VRPSPRTHDEVYEAGDPSALGLDGAGECLISVPGIHIFGSLGRRELKVQLLPTRQTKSSERGGNPRVRQAFGGRSPTPQHAAERRTSQETERKRYSALFPADCAPSD
jgi:hypothetical protein